MVLEVSQERPIAIESPFLLHVYVQSTGSCSCFNKERPRPYYAIDLSMWDKYKMFILSFHVWQKMLLHSYGVIPS